MRQRWCGRSTVPRDLFCGSQIELYSMISEVDDLFGILSQNDRCVKLEPWGCIDRQNLIQKKLNRGTWAFTPMGEVPFPILSIKMLGYFFNTGGRKKNHRNCVMVKAFVLRDILNRFGSGDQHWASNFQFMLRSCLTCNCCVSRIQNFGVSVETFVSNNINCSKLSQVRKCPLQSLPGEKYYHFFEIFPTSFCNKLYG